MVRANKAAQEPKRLLRLIQCILKSRRDIRPSAGIVNRVIPASPGSLHREQADGATGSRQRRRPAGAAGLNSSRHAHNDMRPQRKDVAVRGHHQHCNRAADLRRARGVKSSTRVIKERDRRALAPARGLALPDKGTGGIRGDGVALIRLRLFEGGDGRLATVLRDNGTSALALDGHSF